MLDNIINGIFNFVTSDKFYLPVIFIGIGILSYEIVSKTIIKVSKINNYIGKNHHSKGYDKRKSTVVGLINNIIKYLIAIIKIIY